MYKLTNQSSPTKQTTPDLRRARRDHLGHRHHFLHPPRLGHIRRPTARATALGGLHHLGGLEEGVGRSRRWSMSTFSRHRAYIHLHIYILTLTFFVPAPVSSSTRQMRHVPRAGMEGWAHSVGTKEPAARAASRIYLNWMWRPWSKSRPSIDCSPTQQNQSTAHNPRTVLYPGTSIGFPLISTDTVSAAATAAADGVNGGCCFLGGGTLIEERGRVWVVAVPGRYGGCSWGGDRSSKDRTRAPRRAAAAGGESIAGCVCVCVWCACLSRGEKCSLVEVSVPSNHPPLD